MHFLYWLSSTSCLVASLVGATVQLSSIPPSSAIDVEVHDEFRIQVQSPNLLERTTRKLILANGLKAFLVSDPGLVKAGAALSVETGNWRDPKGVQGLAHFTEHMLFMGSKEFPAEGEFDRFVSSHGGSNNAYTSGDHCVYYFNVLPAGLLGGLDRLAGFFTSPIFDPSALGRERQAVQSEYNLRFRNDGIRWWQVIQDVMSPTNHPFSHFGCGNLTTLATLDQNSIRNWFSQEYDPRGMHLVVYSHESISVIEDRVKATFGRIASCDDWKGPVRAEQSGPIVPPDVTGSWVYIEPVKDIKTVRLVWEIPHQFADWGNRVGSVVGGALSRIGEGSIFAKLKSESLASSLEAEVENESADSAFLCLEVELTGTGLDNVPRVLEIIFQGIGTLGKLTMPGYIVQQHNALALLDYKWQNRRSDLAFTKQEVVKLRSEEFSAFPKLSLFWEHSPADVAEIFNTHLAPKNCIVYVQAKDLDVTYDKFEPIVGAPYTFSKFSDEEAARFEEAHHSVQDDISYAEESEFIPRDVRALHAVDPTFAKVPRWLPLPTKLDAEDVQTAFVAPDVEFGIPKIDLNTYITSPGLSLGQDAFGRVILHLWLSAVGETTKAMRELAAAGGYHISIGSGETPFPHISVRVAGYSSRGAVNKIMQEVYTALRHPQIKSSQLQIALEEYRLQFQNGELEELYKQTTTYWTRWGTNGSYVCTAGKLVEAVDNLKANEGWLKVAEDEIRHMISQIFVEDAQGFHEFTFLAGNIEDEDVNSLRTVRDEASLTPTLPYPEKIDFFRPSFIGDSGQPTFLHRGMPDIPTGRAAVRLAVPVGNFTNPLANAFAHTIDAVCAGQFFAALRTRDQLGYVVGSVLKELHGKLYMTFIVQTEKVGGTEALKRIEKWVQSWIGGGIGERDEYIEIDGATSTTTPFEEHFDKIKEGVVTEWSSKHASLGEKTAEQLNLLVNAGDNLDLLDQNLEELEGLSRDKFRELVNFHFGTGKSDWRAIVLDGAKGEGTFSTELEGWSVVTKDDLDFEDGISDLPS